MLLIIAFFTSYLLQQKKITAVHETVISIFAGSYQDPCVLYDALRMFPWVLTLSRDDRRTVPRYYSWRFYP